MDGPRLLGSQINLNIRTARDSFETDCIGGQNASCRNFGRLSQINAGLEGIPYRIGKIKSQSETRLRFNRKACFLYLGAFSIPPKCQC